MLAVLFKCRSLSVFEIIDSSYLSALDFMTVLNAGDSQPMEYGYYYIENQSIKEGDVTRAAVAFTAMNPTTDRPDPIKILMSTGLFGVKYLLTNAPEELLEQPVDKWDVDDELLERSRGAGYPPGIILYPSYKAAKDMWVVDDIRMKQLAQYGITNARLEKLHTHAADALKKARENLASQDYEGFIAASREAWGLEARGYPEVMSTANDTVRGIIFYFILLLPFSFFCERLLFGFPDITRRLVGFAGIFVLFFIILRYVHPAFKLSSTPYIIFLAFVIMALGGIAMFIVVSKFGEEVRKMKQASAGTYEADVGRLSATAASIILGISNLRKRPLRTGLTAITLTLLTFTALSFTSVQDIHQILSPAEGQPAAVPGRPGTGSILEGIAGIRTSVPDQRFQGPCDHCSPCVVSFAGSRGTGVRQFLADHGSDFLPGLKRHLCRFRRGHHHRKGQLRKRLAGSYRGRT